VPPLPLRARKRLWSPALRGIAVLSLLGLAGSPGNGASKGPVRPPLPYKDAGACPFEGCVYRDWTVNRDTPLRRSPDRSAAVQWTVRKGETVRAETGFVLTLKPGRARVVRKVRVGQRTAAPGQVVYLLHYVGEGHFLVWLEGSTENLPAGAKDDPLVLIRQPEARWWVRIRCRNGRSGWTDQPESFGNKDLLAAGTPPADDLASLTDLKTTL
jgi:hypothetical protein